MGESPGIDHERVNAFPVADRYLFRHYFERKRVFDYLREYYENQHYRFAVPTGEFEAVQAFLADEGYGLVEVDSVDEFAVVVRKYTRHPDRIFKYSVIRRSVGKYNCFLLKDQAAVERAVGGGATRLTATGLESPF